MIYLDNAATTKMYEGGAELYKKYACQSFYNPSAGYGEAIEIKKELDNVRSLIKAKLNSSHGDVIFTGGATESNNLAIMGSRRNGKFEYIFSEGGHPSTYNVAKELERQGFIVHFVKLQENGQVDYSQIESLLNDKTRLISVEHVSNETGAINDILKISKMRSLKAPKALLHVDGVQAFCKIEINIDTLNVDLYSLSAHKFHGPKGVGALYVKNIEPLKSIVFGGGQEDGYRSGTENVPGIMAMGYAIDKADVNDNLQKASKFNKLLKSMLERDEHIHINNIVGSPYIISLWFEGVNGETLMRALSGRGVIVGTGSACSTKKAGNRVLESMGYKKEQIKSHLRISFDEFLTEEEVRKAGEIIVEEYNKLRERVL